jgi:hypothetical protein
VLERERLDGARSGAQAATRGAVGLSEDGDDAVSRGMQRRERAYGEFWRPGES